MTKKCPTHEARQETVFQVGLRHSFGIRPSSFFRHSCFVVTHSIICFLISARAAEKVDLTKLPPPATNQVDFARDIRPLFERSCLRCHGPERPKSKFRLDNRESALKGGEDNSDDIVPGHSAESKLIHYVARLASDLEMPPKGKGDPLSAQEVALLRAWIDQGAPWQASALAGPEAVVVPGFGGVTVSGDRQMFREHYWMRDNWNLGVQEFTLTDPLGTDGKATITGHAFRDDYKLSLALEKRELGFTRMGWERYRKYYDDRGGYFPSFTPSILSLDRDLYLDRGKAWIDFGLTIPDWPKLTVGYEYQYRQGTEATLQWGLVQQGTDQRNIYPAAKTVHERVHVVKFDLEHDIGGVHIEDSFRGEFLDLKTERQNTRSLSLDDPTSFWKDNVHDGYQSFQGANALRVEKSFTDWFFGSAGYLFSKLNADAAFSLDPLIAPFFGADRWQSQQIVLEQDTHALNLTALLGPWEGLTLSGGILGESTHQQGFGSADKDVLFNNGTGIDLISSNLVALDANQNRSAVEESVALRYTTIPFTSLFAHARLQQESIGEFEEENGGTTDFLHRTDASSELRDFRFGFNSSPWRRISFGADYRKYKKESDYRHRRDESNVIPSGDGYPAFIRSRDVDTDEIEGRIVLRPALWLKTTLTYKHTSTRYETETDAATFINPDDATPGGWAPATHFRAHFGSANVTVNPWQRCYFSGTFSYQRSQIAAFANGVSSVVPYRGDVYSVIASATFLLSKNTDFQATYAFSEANYAQDNFADGLPVGMKYSRHAVTGGFTERLAHFLSARLQYGFYNYDEPSSGGARNYAAHAVFGTLVFHLQ